MEVVKDRSTGPAMSGGSKLRYPLRSAGRPEDGRSAMPDPSISSSSRRVRRPSSCVSQSVDGLNLSAKEKSSRPSRRLSNPTSLPANPRSAPRGSITPISEIRTQGRSNTPLSEIPSSTTSRRKFSVLTSISYWLTQIKLAESASRHSISLGFFKLALESGCEPMQRMREELKSYAIRHNLLSELAEATQDLLQLYHILEDFQKLKISDKGSPLLEAVESTLNEDSQRFLVGAGNLKPRSLNPGVLGTTELNKKGRGQTRLSTGKDTISISKKPANPVSVKDDNCKIIRKKAQKPIGLASDSRNAKIKSSQKSMDEKADPSPAEEASSHDDKENMDVLSMEESIIEEEIEAT